MSIELLIYWFRIEPWSDKTFLTSKPFCQNPIAQAGRAQADWGIFFKEPDTVLYNYNSLPNNSE